MFYPRQIVLIHLWVYELILFNDFKSDLIFSSISQFWLIYKPLYIVCISWIFIFLDIHFTNLLKR